MMYILELKNEDKIKSIISSGNEYDITKYLESINSLSSYVISNFKYYMSKTGVFYFKQNMCVIDMNFARFNEFNETLSKNYNIYHNLLSYIRDQKLKKLNI